VNELRRPVLLYDAGCRFCRFAARCVARLDVRGRLAFLPLEDVEAARFLDTLPEDERYASWRLVHRDGSLLGYGAARGRLPDAIYAFVARHRSFLGRLVPDGAAPRRFP
jgi:predicted DCC family thiol-disulfide oxidoreductase YuxK